MTVVNYLEGTRFSEQKKARQQSPYRHLLKPKAGGVAFVLAALGEQLDALLDVTVVYPSDKVPGFWDLLCGRVPKVIVDIQTRPIDPALWQGDYENDPVFRQYVQEWVSRMWKKRTNASPACGNCAEVPAEAHPSRRADNAGGVIRPTGAGNEYPGSHPLVGRITATRLSAVSTAQRRITPGALFALPERATNTRGRTHLVGRITATRLSAVSTERRRITPGALFALPVQATNIRAPHHFVGRITAARLSADPLAADQSSDEPPALLTPQRLLRLPSSSLLAPCLPK